MRLLILFIAVLALSGCVSVPDADLADGNGPYFDGGYYYAPPRPVDVDVEQRAYVSESYWYPYGYAYGRSPFFYGGYRNRWYGDPHDHRDHNGGRWPTPGDLPTAGKAPHAVAGPVRSAPSPLSAGGSHGGAHGHR